jgi:hypothetical protein
MGLVNGPDPHLNSPIQQDNEEFYFLLGFNYPLAGIRIVILGGKPLPIVGIIGLVGPIFSGIPGFAFLIVFAAIYKRLNPMACGFEFEVKISGERNKCAHTPHHRMRQKKPALGDLILLPRQSIEAKSQKLPRLTMTMKPMENPG